MLRRVFVANKLGGASGRVLSLCNRLENFEHFI